MSMTEPGAGAPRTPLSNDDLPHAPPGDPPARARAPEGKAPSGRAPARQTPVPDPAAPTAGRSILWNWVLFLVGTGGVFAVLAWLA